MLIWNTAKRGRVGLNGAGCKSLKQHSCFHVSDEYRKLCSAAAMLPARPDLPPARPDIIPPPPVFPGVYPPPHPEIIYPSRAPPVHRKRERNNLSLHLFKKTYISQEQCAPFRCWCLLLSLCGRGGSGYPFNQSLPTMYLMARYLSH